MKTKKLYNVLKSNKKKMFIRSFIMAVFLLSANTFAWFIYIDKFDGSISANVISWDVTFYDDDESINDLSLNISSLYPGMSNYNKNIVVNNTGELLASFNYQILSFTLFGETYNVSDPHPTSNELLSDLATAFPFRIVFGSSKNEIEPGGDTSTFSIGATWNYESASPYYRLNEYFDYNSTYDYYVFDSDSYVLDNAVTSSNYASKLVTGLYVESDVADSYWGKKASEYLSLHPTGSCLTLQMKLIVTQKNE